MSFLKALLFDFLKSVAIDLIAWVKKFFEQQAQDNKSIKDATEVEIIAEAIGEVEKMPDSLHKTQKLQKLRHELRQALKRQHSNIIN